MSAIQTSCYWPDIESGKMPAYWNSGKIVHACEGAEVVPHTFLAWTKCGRDVPSGGLYIAKNGEDAVTCPKCLGASQ